MHPWFRHIQLVVIDGGRARAYGTGHHAPRSCPVSLRTAVALARQGVKVVHR